MLPKVDLKEKKNSTQVASIGLKINIAMANSDYVNTENLDQYANQYDKVENKRGNKSRERDYFAFDNVQSKQNTATKVKPSRTTGQNVFHAISKTQTLPFAPAEGEGMQHVIKSNFVHQTKVSPANQFLGV